MHWVPLVSAATHFTGGKGRDSDGWYLQNYLQADHWHQDWRSLRRIKLDTASGEASAGNNLVKENQNWTIGVYHPLTKSLNLVAEYNDNESKAHSGLKNESKGVSLGAILFF